MIYFAYWLTLTILGTLTIGLPILHNYDRMR